MKCDEVLEILRSHQSQLREHGIASLSVFGSVVRDAAVDSSDVDLLVEFNRPVGLFAFVRTRRYLAELLGCEVDLVTPDALKPAMRDNILKEAVRAA